MQPRRQQDPQTEIDNDSRRVRAVAFSANGKYFASGGERCVRVWRVEDSKEMATLMDSEEAGVSMDCLAVSNDGRWIAAGSFFEWVFLWDAKTFERVFDRKKEHHSVYGIDFSPDSATLLVASGNTATVQDVESPRRIPLRPLHHGNWLKAAKYSPTGDRIATASDNSVRVWDSSDGHLIAEVEAKVTLPFNKGLRWFDHNHLCVVSGNEIRLLSTSRGSKAFECLAPRADNISCIALPRHGGFVAYSTDRTITFLDTSGNTQLGHIEHTEPIESIALSPDDRLIVIGGRSGNIAVKGLSHIRSLLGYLFQESDIHIDDAILNFWKQDRLAEAESSLTAKSSTSHNTNCLVLAYRALVRTRLRQWDAAIIDADKSIVIRPSVIGYIAKSIALSGKGEKNGAYRACDLAFQNLRSIHVRFLLLVKAIIVFMVGEHEDAVSRIDDLLAIVPSNTVYCAVQAYMHLFIGNSHMRNSDYEGAIKSLEYARARLINFAEDDLIAITLIFGWKFDGLGTRIQQQLCEALYAAGRMREAGESLLEMINSFSEETYTKDTLTEWVSLFTHRYLSASHCNGDAVLEVAQFGEALSSHTALDSTTPTMLLQVWSKATLLFRQWRDTLISSTSFRVPRSSVYVAICEHLETSNRIIEASECFCQMVDELTKINGQDMRTKWIFEFRQRCTAKITDLGDAALNTEQNDDAIACYSAALALNAVKPQGLLIKRSKAHIGRGSWKEALDDAQMVITLDPSSPWGYERKHAALHEAGHYDKAIQAFEEMLSKMSRSLDVKTRGHRRKYVDPAQTTKTIRRTVRDIIQDSPRILISTISGRLCDKSEQAAAFESLPVFKQLISSMTTEIDHSHIQHVVREYYRYAAFSHTWEEDEPLFEKVIHIVVYDLEESPTHDKLQMFCKIARDSGFNWAWSDTCCINKANHFVLQEAIVTMFKWYEGSALTIIFLRGVRSRSQRGDLVKSVWNSRAWTFQEYHASKVVKFYTEDWKPYMNLDVQNHKECPEIISEMEEATGISAQALMSLRPGLDDIRGKLYLASGRKTSFVEDAAYSLLGIFSISLPVVYGERDKALGRLLGQLLASSGDTSILAWTGKSGSFNSCLPAAISVFSSLQTTHIPPAVDGAEMDKAIVSLNSIMVVRLYDRLLELPVPSLAGRRIKLPCITFKLGPVSTSHSNSGQVFRAQTAALGIVEIQTNENLSKFNSLYLVHPWIDFLLDRQPVGSPSGTFPVEFEDFGDPSSSTGVPLSFPGHSIAPAVPKVSLLARIVTLFGLPLTGQPASPTRVQDAASLRPPSSVSIVDKQMRARRVITQLRQPFGALLLTPSPDDVAAYKRIATESLITVQVVEDITPTVLNKLIDGVRILDIL